MKPLFEKTVTEIVEENYRAASVFSRYGISYCCGGNLSLESACLHASLDKEALLRELYVVSRSLTVSNRLPFENWKLSFLIDYIIHVHHGYLEIILPELESAILGFYDSHRKKFPFFRDILETYRELFGTLHQQNLLEEDIIFPYIKQIETVHGNKEPYGQLFVRTLSKPLNKLESNSSLIENLLTELTAHTNHFRHPENACPKMKVIYKQLEELNNDLVNHKYIETSILLPRASEIEASLLGN